MKDMRLERPGFRRRNIVITLLAAGAIAAVVPVLDGMHAVPEAVESRVAPALGYGELPLSFEPNWGQAAPEVRFSARGADYGLFLTSTDAVLTLTRPGSDAGPGRQGRTTDTVRMSLLGANADAPVAGGELLSGRVNYLKGADRSRWLTDVPTYGRVSYRGVYPGVDLDYYGRQGHVKYDFLVAPGTDPEIIRLAISGVQALSLDPDGNLLLDTPGGRVVHHAPVIYQDHEAGRRTVAGSYVVQGDQVGFAVGDYDPRYPLVIDPELSYSTYLGGATADEAAADIAVDAAGSAYITGITSSSDFPTVSPFQATLNSDNDAFITKLAPDGRSLVYSTYLGGEGFDEGTGIAVDATGNAYVTGTTGSVNFPTVSAFQPAHSSGFGEEVFVTKLNPAGSALLYSTYLGGTNYDNGYDIAVDGSGSAYVTGVTFSNNFPTANAFQATRQGIDTNAFVTKLTPAGSALAYSTYLGRLADEGRGIAVDPSGSAYVTGVTLASNFPAINAFRATSGGSYDAFVTKFAATGTTLVYSTYLGGNGEDNGNDIAVDASGAAYVTGTTYSTNFPTASPLQASRKGPADAFVTKFAPTGATLAYSTYLGGTAYGEGEGGYEQGRGIAVDAAGGAYVTGETSSDDFPLVDPIQQRPGGFFNANDVFVSHLNPAGSALVYSTVLGGSDLDGGTSGHNDEGNGIAVDAGGNAYVAGVTDTANFPTTASAFQPNQSQNNSADAFIAKIVKDRSHAPADFDGDGDTDISIFRPSQGAWHIQAQATVFHGTSGDIPVACDYDGNGTTDRAVFRPSVGGWYVQDQAPVFFGLSGDIPVPADYNGDGDCEIAVFRPSVGGWYRLGLSTEFFGLNGDVPVPADYDGDGDADITIYRPPVGGWYRQGAATTFFGLSSDVPVPGDYDGDGDIDVAVYRPAVGGWYVNGQTTQFLGLSSDIPVPGDYNGDGDTERAVFRPSTGAWFIEGMTTQFLGTSGDRPVPLLEAIQRAYYP